MHTRSLLLAVASGLALFPGCASDPDPVADPAVVEPAPAVQDAPPATVSTPVLSVQDQAVAGDAVVIAEADVPADGWVVVHREAAGGGPQVPAIIGKAFLTAGPHADVSVPLDEPVDSGETLFAMLHADTGEAGAYEFDGADTPDQPLTEGGGPVVQPFVVQ